ERTQPAHRFTIIEFSSITCGACVANLPHLLELSKKVKDSATLRLIFIDRNEAAIRNFVNQRRNVLKFPVALDNERQATPSYNIEWTPTMFIVDEQNVIRYKHIG